MISPTRWGFECFGCRVVAHDTSIVEFMQNHMHGISMDLATKCETEIDSSGEKRIVFPDVPDDPVRWVDGGENETSERLLSTWIRMWPLIDHLDE